ncbi:hypothetical protein DXV76_19595 [Rhodobacteraceae bacterium CCMM004]|nr:hypothetical protein DXV76_19595 [Rhodobacteraceae bacterium CCMM004]
MDDALARALRLIAPRLLCPPHTEAARMTVVHGAQDLLCPPQPIWALAEEWGIGDVRTVSAGHRSFGLHIPKVRRLLADVMKNHPPRGSSSP